MPDELSLAHAEPGRWPLDNSYARLPDRFYARLTPTPVATPRLVKLNVALARHLGLDPEALASPEGVAMLAGNALPEGAEPIALAYAGHQFGNFVPQLGDGRRCCSARWSMSPGCAATSSSRARARRRSRAAATAARARAGAARIHHQRGDACARRADHALARGGHDRRAGLSRDRRCPARC
jgi:hypothetical protein